MTAEAVEAKAREIAKSLEDGIQVQDVFEAIPKVMEIAEGVKGLSGAEKKQLALALFNRVIDLVPDVPGPDYVVKPVLKGIAPFVVDMIAKASAGEFEINA